jgi:hypothetical protein
MYSAIVVLLFFLIVGYNRALVFFNTAIGADALSVWQTVAHFSRFDALSAERAVIP